MIVYLDASALVKRYVKESAAADVGTLITDADLSGTAVISRAEVSAALAKANRVGTLSTLEALAALERFRHDWLDVVRLRVTESLVSQADSAAWDYGLRGYDAVHLAAAQRWEETVGQPVTLATFDQQLWRATGREA